LNASSVEGPNRNRAPSLMATIPLMRIKESWRHKELECAWISR
jgi:hypothetical protein